VDKTQLRNRSRHKHRSLWAILLGQIGPMRLTTLIWTLLCVSCDIRTSSEDRFTTNIGFSLPADKKVLKDEYQDMLQDYAVIYEVELSVTANQQLIEKLKTLTSADVTDNNCKWYPVDSGFSYKCHKDRTMYFVTYDTIKRIVVYEELAD
jgi:hypothetical protein